MQRNVTFIEKHLHKNLLKVIITKKLEIIAVLQVNIEAHRIIFLI